MTGPDRPAAQQQALAETLRQVLDERGQQWLAQATAAVAADSGAVARLFPAAGRALGRRELADGAAGPWTWTTDEAGRALLLTSLPDDARDGVLRELYRYGDRFERAAVLRALDVLPAGRAAQELVPDALRTNDPRLVAAALSPTGLAVLDERELVQAVLKCVFMGLDLACLPLPEQRITPLLSRALAGYALERLTAGRSVPQDVWPLVERHPPHDVLSAVRRLRSGHDPAEEPAR